MDEDLPSAKRIYGHNFVRIKGLERFADERVHLISGGANKALDLAPLADSIKQYVSTLTLIDGSATPVLLELIQGAEFPINGPYRDMESALDAYRTQSSPELFGKVVITR